MCDIIRIDNNILHYNYIIIYIDIININDIKNIGPSAYKHKNTFCKLF